MARSQSFRFDGGAATFFGTGILAWLLTLFTVGFGYPWALCLFQQWKCKHTFIDGRRLRFTGGGWSLIGLWIKWFVLLLITFGIYSFWLVPSLQKWIAEHTDFDDAGMLPGSQVQNVIVNVETGSGKGGSRPSPTLADSAEAATESHTAVAMSATAVPKPRAGLSAKQKKLLIIGAVALVALTVVGAIVGGNNPSTGSTEGAKADDAKPLKAATDERYAKADVHIEAFQLWHELDTETAKSQYCNGEILEVTGLVLKTRKSGTSAYLSFDIGDPHGELVECTVECKLKPFYADIIGDLGIKRGDYQQVRGKCKGKWGNQVSMTDCELGPFADVKPIQRTMDSSIATGNQPSVAGTHRPVENIPPTVSQPTQKQEPAPSKVETPAPTKVETPQPSPTVQPTPQQPAPETPAGVATSNVHSVTLKDGTKLTLDFSYLPSTTTILKVWLLNEVDAGASKLKYFSLDYKHSGLQGDAVPKFSHPALVSNPVTLPKTGFAIFTLDVTKLTGNTVKFTLEK